MNTIKSMKRLIAVLLVFLMAIPAMPMSALAAEADDTLNASLDKAITYIDALTINNSSNDPAKVVKTFKTHFTWDNEKRENSKSYLYDWSYYNGVVFEGLEYLYENTGDTAYRDYVVEYMSSLIASDGSWAKCTNSGYTSKQCAGYNSTHGADCYKTASLLLDAYEMTNDNRYLKMAATLYADLDSAANSYSLKNAGYNYRHTWASDPTPDLWLDGLYMILPFRAEYAKYIGDQDELDLIVSRMQWVSDNMYNNSKKLFYHAADSASSNSGTYWLRSIGWYAAAIVDIMDSMEGENLEAMKAQLVKLVDGMKACQNASNGMWLNNMNASLSSSNPYETSGTALVCYAVMKAVNEGWLDSGYADMAILAFNGICNEKLSGTTLTDICFKGAPGSSNSTFYDNEGKGVGPFIMFYAEVLEYVNNSACEHIYNVETVEPTCTAEGSSTYTCTLCGESYVEVINATGHNYKAVVTAPDCLNGGYTTYTCTLCGDIYVSDYKEALGHNYTLEVTEATCAENGRIVYTCECGDSYSEVIPATGNHSYESRITEATCTENGIIEYSCEVCGDSYSEVIEAKGHNYNKAVTEPTCTASGYTTYTCASCGDTYVSDYVEALGHSYSENITEATCVEPGKIVYTCSCGDTYEEIIPATGKHVYDITVVDATCSKDGSITYTCGCGYSYSEVIPATGNHEYTSLTIDATCTEAGKVTYTCSCGDSYSEVIEAKGHNYNKVVTEPTCTASGFTTHTCENCGDTYTDSYIAAKGHSYNAVVTAPTCETEGFTTYTCECGDTYADDYTAALGHNYQATVTAPTCTRDGYTTYTCSICSDSYKSDIVAALGHSYGSIVKEPTCTEGGYTTYFCSCGDSYIADETAALGHSYETVVTAPTCENEGFTTYTCAVCGDTYVSDIIEATGHNYEYTDVNGTRIYTCTYCGDTYEESINWVNVGGTYVLDTDGIDLGSDNKYIIVGSNNNYALKLSNGTVSASAVSISNNTITLDDASEYEFYFVSNSKENGTYLLTQDGSNTVYHSNGNMYYGNDNKGYWYVSSSGNGLYRVYDYDNLNWYLNYGYVWASDSVSRFAVSSNSRTVRLYKAADSYLRLMGTLEQSYEHIDAITVDDIISKLYIEKSADGKTADSTVAVTSDMLSWDKTFSGTEAGTYTAVISYNGAELGTITVTINGEHQYSAVVTAATCTEGGYTTYTCECGKTYVADETAALGHNYTSVETDTAIVYTCTNCGHTYEESIAIELSYNRVSAFASGEKYVIALYSSGKYYALSHEDNSISATRITVSNGVITSEVTEDILWDYSGSKLSYDDNGTTRYLYLSSSWSWGWWGSSYTLTLSTSNSSTVTLTNNRIKVDSRYLRYSGGTITNSSSGTTSYIFEETEE